MSEPDFPILGTEPLAVELANTLYGSGDGRIDYLQSAEWIDQWFAVVSPSHRLPVPLRPAREDADQVRDLRDCVYLLVSAAIDGRAPDLGAVKRLNSFAAAAPTSLLLDWPRDGARASRRLDSVDGIAAVLGRIATCCVELLAGPAAGELRRCEGPGCGLFFVRNHARRRWCHPSCGQRDRQARYYRRHLAPAVAR